MENESDRVLMLALKEASEMHATYFGSEHLLLAILKETTIDVSLLLKALGMQYDKVKKEICIHYQEKCHLDDTQSMTAILKESFDARSMVVAMMHEKCMANILLKGYAINPENIMH